MKPKKKKSRDLAKFYSAKEFAKKLRRFADAVEGKKPFSIQIAGERVYVPAQAKFNIEHEREGKAEEIEFQIFWSPE